MLLLSVKSPDKMFAEIVAIERTLQSKENAHSFVLQSHCTDAHQITLVVEDEHSQHAIFHTESYHITNTIANRLIDYVILVKMILGAQEQLSNKQLTIVLPEKQVSVKVISIVSEIKDIVYLYCFY